MKLLKNYVVIVGDIFIVNCSLKGDGMLFVLWSCEYVKFLDWRVIVCKDGILVII